jgi:hypothetical protein
MLAGLGSRNLFCGAFADRGRGPPDNIFFRRLK